MLTFRDYLQLVEDASSLSTPITWTDKHYRSSIDSGDYAVVWVDIAKFEKAFQKDDNGYVGPGGTVNAIGSRYQDFGEWLKKGIPVEMPAAYIGHPEYRGHVSFGNGRHRYAWMRDHGATALPVIVPSDQAAKMAKLYGTNERKTILRK